MASRQTSTQVLNEDPSNDQEVGYIMDLCLRLLPPVLDNTGFVCYYDKAFTSIRLAAALAKRRIHLVGMFRGVRPKKPKRGWNWYWPFTSYGKKEECEHRPGWQRCAWTPFEGTGMHLKAEAWMDNRHVTMLSTTWHSDAVETVERWSRSTRKREVRTCSVGLKRYSLGMGAVDRFNKLLAGTGIRMNRCRIRFQRQLFLSFLLPLVVVDTMIVWLEMMPRNDAEQLKKKHNNLGGFNTWFQNQLGCAMIEHGNKLMADKLGTPRKRAAENLVPVGVPKKKGRKAKRGVGFEDHAHLAEHKRAYLGRQGPRCAACNAELAARGNRGTQEEWDKIPRPTFGCVVCKVRLCKRCHSDDARWDHGRKKAPTAPIIIRGQ